MFPEPISRTALLTAAARAAESRRPAPLLVDPFAAALAGEAGEAFHQSVPGSEARTATLAIRTRVFDDAIVAAASSHATQVLLLAAGLDTRAWRLDLPADLRWFEVDHQEVLDHKARVLGDAPCRVARTTLPFDLREPGVGDALAAAGFDPTRRTVLVIEGLVMYLAEEAVSALLSSFAGLLPAGSTLLIDIPNRAAIDPTGVMGPLLARLAADGSPWRFGVDEPGPLLARAGWAVDEVIFAGHPRAFPERVPWPVAASLPRSWPATWLVRASRAGGVTP
jgi:methyltransferase (TIGR00027 family)